MNEEELKKNLTKWYYEEYLRAYKPPRFIFWPLTVYGATIVLLVILVILKH